MRDLARLAIAAFGRQGERSGVIGVDVQRIRRALGLQAERAPRTTAQPALDRENLRQFERHLRRELERALIERTEKLPPSRPLAELDRTLPTQPGPGPRRGAPRGRPAEAPDRDARATSSAGGSRSRAVDVRRTMRASLETGGVPLRLRYRPEAPAAPRDLRALRRLDLGHAARASSSSRSCTRSTTRSASCAASSSSSGSARSPRSSSTSATSGRSPSGSPPRAGSPTCRATPTTAASGSSSSRRSPRTSDPRSTVIVLGDARTNGREPHAADLRRDRRARRPHLLAQPRAEALLELRRLGDGRLRALLRRRLRVLDDQAPRELRQRGRRRRRRRDYVRLADPRSSSLGSATGPGARASRG